MARPCPALRPLCAEFFEHQNQSTPGHPHETARNLVLFLDITIVEPQQRAHSPWLAARLASESKIDRIPYGRRFLRNCNILVESFLLVDLDQ